MLFTLDHTKITFQDFQINYNIGKKVTNKLHKQ